ncbi:hypothetical protein O6P32_10880 [Phocaeicola sp. KGMB11183]|uniref:O-antigen ligase domain-containing protein n=1 Tax=Phocaeicola acetigenes TaxID=3016083 RepID=A0ABT4PJG7_9BACT|nr:hypothetical protein [Phocaeicola sp. KGMB11183]MCZ8373204.1 hypothetical protein [Phocaeicola sp. KGMB11183]
MIKVIGILLTLIVTSLYLFPFELKHLPGANTKMIMAGLGLIVIGIQMARQKNPLINTGFFKLVLLASLVSLIGLFAVVFNDTSDFEYATYIVSMLVWISAAYVVITWMKFVHETVSVELLAKYIVAVSVMQCVLALAIDSYMPLKQLVNSIMVVTRIMETRLYGMDASLDIAGSRFSVALVLIVYLMNRISKNKSIYKSISYIVAFFIIAIVGNMISRTTTVGVIVALCYFILLLLRNQYNSVVKLRYISILFVGILVCLIPFLCYLYQVNTSFHENIRFAFEGFFSLAEKGRWEVHSNDMLKNMYVFPDNLKTWFIGDGYFDNPYYSEPYYVGPKMGGYYMGTDVGYLRFIYYFGLIGLFAFSAFMLKIGQILMNRFHEERIMFLIIILLNFIVWFKVSTDLFVVYALFLMIPKSGDEGFDKCLKLERT